MCIECIITWIVVPSAACYAAYWFILRKCINHYNAMARSYVELEEKFENTNQNFRKAMDKVNEYDEWRTYHCSEWEKEFIELELVYDRLFNLLEDRVTILEKSKRKTK